MKYGRAAVFCAVLPIVTLLATANPSATQGEEQQDETATRLAEVPQRCLLCSGSGVRFLNSA